MSTNPSVLEQSIQHALDKHMSSKTLEDRDYWWQIFKDLHYQRSTSTILEMELKQGLVNEVV